MTQIQLIYATNRNVFFYITIHVLPHIHINYTFDIMLLCCVCRTIIIFLGPLMCNSWLRPWMDMDGRLASSPAWTPWSGSIWSCMLRPSSRLLHAATLDLHCSDLATNVVGQWSLPY